MTPVPKSIVGTKKALIWRAAIRKGINPVKAAALAARGKRINYPS